MRDTTGEVKASSSATISSWPLHTDKQALGVRLEPIYNRSVLTQDVVLRTSQMRWMTETNGEGKSGKSMLAERHDDDDEVLHYNPDIRDPDIRVFSLVPN